MNAQVKTGICFALTILTSLGGIVHMTKMPEPGEEGFVAQADPSYDSRQRAERLRSSVIFQVKEIGRRSSRFSAQQPRLIEFLEFALRSGGFKVSVEDYTAAKDKHQNVIGILPGTGEGTIVIGTHYDSYGKSLCANASASGVAALVETVRSLRGQSFEKTIIVGFFGTGEAPHTGEVTAGASVWLTKALESGMQIDQAIIVSSFGRFGAGGTGQNSAFPWYLTHPTTSDWVGMYAPFTDKDAVKDALRRWGLVSNLPARGFAAPAWMPGIPRTDQLPFVDAGIRTIVVSDTGPERDANFGKKADLGYDFNFQEMGLRVEALIELVKSYAEDKPTS